MMEAPMATKRHILDELTERDMVTQIAEIQARRPVSPERRVRESARAQCVTRDRMLASSPAWEPHERAAAGMDEEPCRFAFDLAAQERMAHWLAQWGPLIVILGAIAWLAVWIG